jgi:glycosyltransferase involved in cell wall biosynthesis
VFHAPAYTAPLWQGQPLILTIHDVVYARHPEWYPGELDPIRQWFYRRSARRARRIVTDSAFSRSEIAAAYGVPVERIDVVPLAASRVFSPGGGVRRGGGVLHVGDLHVRRNLPLLLDAILQLRREAVVADVTLTLVGVDRGVLPALRRQAADAGDPDALVYAGVISDEALAEQYRSAAVFAYPSRYEGFGVPLLEAMQCGTPVVGSRAASIPEVVGTAGLLVDPDDRRGWVEAIRAVLTDAARAAALGDAGVTRAAGFTWAATAAATTDVYRRAIAGRP